MHVAHEALKDGDFFRALQRLDAHRPAFGVPASAGFALKRADGEPDRRFGCWLLRQGFKQPNFEAIAL